MKNIGELPIILGIHRGEQLIEVLILNISGDQYEKVIRDWEYFEREHVVDNVIHIPELIRYLKGKGYIFEYRVNGGEIHSPCNLQ